MILIHVDHDPTPSEHGTVPFSRQGLDTLIDEDAALAICRATVFLRSHALRTNGHRLALTGKTVAELVSKLEAVSPDVPTTPHSSAPPAAFVFTGQGSEYWSMGKALYASSPTFRAFMQECSSRLLLTSMH